MPNREVVVKITTDVDQAKAGLTSAGEAMRGLGAAGTEAKTALDPVDEVIQRINDAAEEGTLTWKQFEIELSKLPKPLGEVARGVVEAQMALQKMADSGEKGPAALGRAAGQAQAKVEALAAALEAAEKAGMSVGPEIAAGLQKAEAEISKVAQKAAVAKDAMGDLASRSKLSAEGFEAAAASAGSFGGMLSGLASTSTGAAASMAKAGIAARAFVAALTAGIEVGKKIDEWLKGHGVNLAETTSKWIMAAQGIQDFGNKIAEWNIKGISQVSILAQQRNAFHLLNESLGKSSSGMASFLASQQEGQRLVGGLDQILKTFGHTVQQQDAWLKKYAKAMDDDLIRALKNGSTNTRTLTEDQKKLVDQIIRFGDAATQAAQKLIAAKRQEIAESQKSVSASVAEMNAKLKALGEMTVSEEEYVSRKKAILAEMQAVVVASATKEAEMYELQKKKLGEVDEAYKGTSQTVGELAGAQDANSTATGASAEAASRAKSGIDEMKLSSDEAKTSLEAQGTAHGTLADAADKSAGITARAATAFADLNDNATKTGQSLPSVAVGFEASHSGAEKLASSGNKVKITLGEIQTQADEAAAALRRFASQADAAASSAAKLAGSGGGGGGGGGEMMSSH